MNHIARLTADRAALRAQMQEIRNELIDLRVYLASSKFQGDGNDYVHVSTDIAPKLARLSTLALCEEG
jgi:hypothetical protein